MNNENQPQFEKDLAQAAEPEEFDGEHVEPINDPAESLRKSLASLYESYFQEIRDRLFAGSIDPKKADELVAQIDNLSRVDLGYEVSKGLPLEIAKEIMGSGKFFGPEEVEKAGIEIAEEIPQIPFSPQELKRAQELGQMLIYRTSISINEIDELVRTKLNPNGDDNFINCQGGRKPPDYFSEPIPPGWALVSKDIVPGTDRRFNFRQTECLIEYLVDTVFQGELMPEDYEIAISEFNSQVVGIEKLLGRSVSQLMSLEVDMRICKILHGLKINQFIRPTPAEIIYDWLVCFQNTGEHIFNYRHIMTSTPHNPSQFACVFLPRSWCIMITGYDPLSLGLDGSTIFSRRF